MASAKQIAARKKFSAASKACKGLKKTARNSCMRTKLKHK